MNRIKRTGISLMALMTALAVFPISVFATGEDVLEAAPEVVLKAAPTAEEKKPEEQKEQEEAETTAAGMAVDPPAGGIFGENPYLPDLLRPDYDEDNAAQTETPDGYRPVTAFTLKEYRRIRELIAAVKAGEQSLKSVSYPEQPEELRVGVYPLDPGDFSGESWYVTLPDRKLENNDLLYLLSCFDKLGIEFNPDELNSRNCMRGFLNDGASRNLTAEEEERMAAIRRQIAHGMLTKEDVHPEKECTVISTWYGPLCLYPYRRITDDELAAFAMAKETVWEDRPDDVEKTAREFALSVTELPLSMELNTADKLMIPYTDRAQGYNLTFGISYTDAAGKAAEADEVPCSVHVFLRKRMDNGAIVPDSMQISYSPLRLKEEGEALSRDELTEIGGKWLEEHVLLPLDRHYTVEEIGGTYRVTVRSPGWSVFAELSPDGTVQMLSVQYKV